MSQGLHTLVVGASLAGVTVATQLRSLGYAGAITLLGDEAHAPYSRPPLSKDLLRGTVTEQALMLPTLPADIALRRGTALALDTAACTVTLADGERRGYDRLVIASGARARRVVPHGAVREYCVRGLDDALAVAAGYAAAGHRRGLYRHGGGVGVPGSGVRGRRAVPQRALGR